MHLVDLAGSERLSLSGAEGDTRLETQQINLSLTALGASDARLTNPDLLLMLSLDHHY